MKNGVKNIQTAGYNGARTVYDYPYWIVETMQYAWGNSPILLNGN